MVGNATVTRDMRAIMRLCVALGLDVAESSGWTTRGRSSVMDVTHGMVHHTASPVDVSRLLRDGRPDLPGPLCNWETRLNGLVVAIASGRANHAGVASVSSTNSLGNECTGPVPTGNTGTGAFPQYSAIIRLSAAETIYYDRPIDRIVGHKEVALPRGRKVDPVFSMPAFRMDVREIVAGYKRGDDMALTAETRKFLNELGEHISRRTVHAIMTGGLGQWATPDRAGWEFYTPTVRGAALQHLMAKLSGLPSTETIRTALKDALATDTADWSEADREAHAERVTQGLLRELLERAGMPEEPSPTPPSSS